jgi:NTP pyrophosphatase (non-canonical NTP hydrolase)
MTSNSKGNPFNNEFLDKCKEITDRYERLKGRWSPEAQILHIHSEVQEFNEALRKKTPDDVIEEYADIILSTIACGNYFGFSNERIQQAMIAKLSVVESRLKQLEVSV